MMHPATGAGLYAVELPPDGGTTSWIDLRAAYAGLPERLRREIAGKQAVFSYVKRLAGYQEGSKVISEEAKRKTPPVTHTLLHEHPVTGEPALYLDKTTTIGIVGMGDNAGNTLLDEIYAAALQPEHVYTHHWQVGDLLLWDNGFTMHRREPFDVSARRLMKRTTMILDPARHIVPAGALAEMSAAAE
jgi:alpha-ketoglutarate-dependent taurine dioxygenase